MIDNGLVLDLRELLEDGMGNGNCQLLIIIWVTEALPNIMFSLYNMACSTMIIYPFLQKGMRWMVLFILSENVLRREATVVKKGFEVFPTKKEKTAFPLIFIRTKSKLQWTPYDFLKLHFHLLLFHHYNDPPY